MSLSIEIVSTLYILSILAVFSFILVLSKAVNVLPVRSTRKPMAVSGRKVEAKPVPTYQGVLFTHPDEPQCELNGITAHSVLRIKGWNELGDCDLRVPAPRDGWTHARIERLIELRDLTVWDAYLGDVWIGGSEV